MSEIRLMKPQEDRSKDARSGIGKGQVAERMYPGGNVYRALPYPGAITDAMLADFRRTGFLAIENVFTKQEVEDSRAALSHLIAGGSPGYTAVQIEDAFEGKSIPPGERELHVRKLMGFVDHDARLKAMAFHPTLLGIVKRLIGTDVMLAQDMALLKPPHVGTEKPWHQDTAYFLFDPPELVIGTWTALDDATPENGCMHVTPGSHLQGPRAHFHVRDCQLPDDAVELEKDVVVPLKVGGTLFFGGLLHHGTPPNSSSARRRALQFHYASVNCKPMDTKRHANLFHDGDEYAGCAVWADPTGKLKMRQIKDRVAKG